MRAGRPSWSAEGVASVRALETLIYPPHRRVFDDPIASRVLGGRFRLVQRSRLIGRAVGWIHQHRYAGMPHEVVARARFAQTTLARLAAAGVRQVAILGAGFDPTAWLPDLPDDLIVYEVDRPETQRLKRDRLALAGIETPARLIFVSTDLSRDDLPDTMRRAGFDSSRPALLTAIGLLMYLPPPSVGKLFREIGACLSPDSEVVYNYFSRYMLDPRRSPAGVRRGGWRLARRGEPFLFAADTEEMAALARQAGLIQVESLDGEALTERYFASLGDPRTIERGVNLARSVRLRASSR